MPKDLETVYDGAMGRIADLDEPDRELARKAFSYIFCAKRPLNVGELLHALTVEAGDAEYDVSALPELAILNSVCAGLVVVDEKSGITGLVHHTLQEYLEKHREQLLLNQSCS